MTTNTTEKKGASLKRGPETRFTDTILNKKYVPNPDIQSYNEDFINFVEEEGRVCRLRLFDEADLMIDESKQKQVIPNCQDDDQKSTYLQVSQAIRQNQKDVMMAIMKMEMNSKSFSFNSKSMRIHEKIVGIQEDSYEVIPQVLKESRQRVGEKIAKTEQLDN